MCSAWLLAAVVVALAAAAAPRPASADERPTVTMGQDVVVGPGEVHSGDLLVIRGDVRVHEGGEVDGDVAVAGGDAHIAGEVGGNVWASGRLVLEETAVVGGDAAARGEISRASGARVEGNVWVPRFMRADADSERPTVARRELGVTGALGLAIVTVLLAVAFTVLTTAVAGSAVANVRDAAGHGPVRLLLLGLVATVLLPFLLVALIPVLPLVPLVSAAWLVMLAVGAVGLAEAVGRTALGRHGGRLRAAAFGGFVLALPLAAAMAVVPVLNDLGASGGVVLGAFLCLTGLLAFLSFLAAGAGLITLFGLRSWPSRPFDPSAQPADPLPGAAVVAVGHAVEGEPHAEVAPVTAPVDVVPVSWPEPEPEPEWEPEPELRPEPEPDVEPEPEPEPQWEPEPDMEPEPELRPEPEPAPPPAMEPLRERATEGGDAGGDVRDLPGLSPIYAHLLLRGGIQTVGALAAASVDDVVAAVSAPDVRPVSVETAAEWIAAARAVAEG